MRTRCAFVATDEHLHAGAGGVPHRPVAERVKVEVSAELAVDAMKHVQVERRADAQRIVVRKQEIAFGLHEIRTDQQSASCTDRP
jgi:hypothetical protein